KPVVLAPIALKPMALFESPSVLLNSAPAPTAVLLFPRPFPVTSLLARATSPIAVLAAPWMLLKSALSPRALLLVPSVLKRSELAPTALLKLPVSRPGPGFEPASENSANVPTAVLFIPPPLVKSAPAPTPVFSFALLSRSAPAPTPVFKLAVVLTRSESKPNAELNAPDVMLLRAFCPSAVLPVGRGPGSGVNGLTACVCGDNAKHTNTSGMRRNPRRNGSERAG